MSAGGGEDLGREVTEVAGPLYLSSIGRAVPFAGLEDPMLLVREARERGEEPVMLTVGKPDGVFVGWFIESTGTLVIEGIVTEEAGSGE